MLFALAIVGLAVHFAIYHHTGASAFLNQPEFYYNRFVLRSHSGDWTKDVSLTAGVSTYATAGMVVLFL